jgi:FAD/FMN-containing dehydrogenase
LWALRGGGGNFGVVTSMRVRLHPACDLLAGLIIYNFNEAGVVLRRYATFATTAPDEFGTYAGMLPGPDGKPFAPLDCASYLVMVAPHGDGGMPDLEKVRAFRVPGDTGVNYKADTWHHPLTPLQRIGRFAVLTFVDGTAADEQFVDLPQSILIEE